MAFVATLDRIDKVKNVEDEMMNYVKFKAAMEKRDWDEEDEIAILQIVGTTSYHVLFLDSYNSLDEIKKELKEQSDAKINAPSLNVIIISLIILNSSCFLFFILFCAFFIVFYCFFLKQEIIHLLIL